MISLDEKILCLYKKNQLIKGIDKLFDIETVLGVETRGKTPVVTDKKGV